MYDMSLPAIFSKLNLKDKPQENFLAIGIGPETVTSALWQVVERKTQITRVGTTEDWEMEGQSPERLLTAIDVSLEKIVEQGGSEANKVIFGLQEGWVEGQTILKKYAKTLKTITEKFEFEPIGFVVTTEAIVHMLKLHEGTPPTAILLSVSESELQVTLVSLGTIIGNQTVSRSEDIGADLEEGLARFKGQEQFPSRILLTDSNLDLEGLKQDLLSYNWLEKLPFLHFPKVEILEKNIAITAVAIAGGAEAAKALGLEIVDEEEIGVDHRGLTEEQPLDRKSAEEGGVEETLGDAQQIGFQEGADVAHKGSAETQEEAELIRGETPELPAPEPVKHQKDDDMPRQPSTQTSLMTKLTNLFPRKISLESFKDMLALFRGPRVRVILAVVVLMLLAIGAVVYYISWVLPKAELVLYVRPKTLDKELLITIDPQLDQVSASGSENRIPGKIVETTAMGESQRQTSGTRIVGEKATGEITLYNKTSSPKRFEAGTALLGPSTLTFTLDTEVTVASASSQETEESVTTTFGKAKAPVTAATIGAEYNLDAGTQFVPKGFSQASYDAKNENPITGGTSREVQAVAQEDIDGLIGDLTQTLTEQATVKLEEQEGPGRTVLSAGVRTQVESKELSDEVGDEAQSVSAKLELKLRTLVYEEADFQQLVDRAIAGTIPGDYELTKSDSHMDITEVEFEDSLATVRMVYTAVLIPKIDEEEMKRQLVGKYPGVAEEYLRELPNFTRADIKVYPEALPTRLRTFPRRSQNITIQVRVEND